MFGKNKVTLLPIKIKRLMQEIKKIIEFDKFILYGGAPLDLLSAKKKRINDLDIAIKGIDDFKINRLIKTLKRKGYTIIEPRREYFIFKNEKVILIYAKNRRWFLDIAFLQNPTKVGHFNIESLYIRYPELDLIDKFDTLKNLKKKNILPTQGLKNENPFMLAARFIYLCSKYNISLKKRPNEKILNILRREMKKWKNGGYFHRYEARASFLSSILKSILKAEDRLKFIHELIDSKILENEYLTLEKSLSTLINSNISIKKIRDKKHLIQEISLILNKKDKESLKKLLKQLKLRRWDKEDQNIKI